MVENSDYGDFARRIVTALGRRAGGDVDMLPTMRALAEHVEAETSEAVWRCRAEGYSWAEIGKRLGMTRQAVQQRYSRAADRAIAG